MKNNLIIDFNIDYDVKIYLDKELLGESGYKDTFVETIDKDGLLVVKHGTKKASIRVYGNKKNYVQISYSTTGQLKATFKGGVKEEKETKKVEEKEETVVKPIVTSTPQQQDTGSTIGAVVVLVLIVFGVIWLINGNPFGGSSSSSSSNSSSGSKTDPMDEAISQIQMLIRKAPEKYIYLYNTYTIGSIISADCHSSENTTDGNGRYLLRCRYSYHPKNGAGSTMLDRQNTGGVYAAYIDNGDGTFKYKFGHDGTAYLQEFKNNICWGQSASVKFNCK